MIRWITLATLAVGTGCSVKNVGELDTGMVSETSGNESGESESGSGSGSASGNSMTSVGESSAEVGTSEGESSSAESSTGGCAIDMCGAHSDQDAVFTIDGGQIAPSMELLDVPCTIESVDGMAPSRIVLACTEEDMPVTHTIEVTLHNLAMFNIYAGREVVFDWIVIAPFWSEDYFTLRSPEGNLILAGGHGGTVLPAEGFYLPFAPEVAIPMCGIDTCVGPDDCYQRQRTGIQFGDEVVLDGNEATVTSGATYSIRVQVSEIRHEIMCTDLSDEWHEWLIEDITEG